MQNANITSNIQFDYHKSVHVILPREVKRTKISLVLHNDMLFSFTFLFFFGAGAGGRVILMLGQNEEVYQNMFPQLPVWAMLSFKDFKTSFEANFVAVLLSDVLVWLCFTPFASTSIVTEALPF